jgi:Tfp pilus assembly protein PilV
MRRGFTLVEALVALVLVQFGLLAVAAMSAVAARDVAAATRVSRARDAARERIELLRPAACATSGGGSADAPGLVEHWSVRGDSVVRRIRDSVEFRLPGGRSGRVVVEQVVLCP